MVHGRFHVDQRFVAQLIDHAEQRFLEVGLEILSFGEGPHAEGVAIRGQRGYSLADVFGGAAVHDGAHLRLQLPGALARHDDER